MTPSYRFFARILGPVTLLGAPLSLLDGCSDDLPPDAGDAARDVGATDAGCTCDPGKGSSSGSVSLACYCDGTFGECPVYEDALANCTGGRPPFSRLEEYADCNYAVIITGNGFGNTRYAYDYTTHQIVGARHSTDYDAYVCGSSHVLGYHAGQFPDATCVQSKVEERCGRPDAGEAGPDGATPSAADDATSLAD